MNTKYYNNNKIGLFFGSFNPMHNGHIAIASHILKSGLVSEIWFVISPLNPFKEQSSEIIDEKIRFEMAEIGLGVNPNFKICDIEFSLPKPSYTVDTLDVLSREFPENNFSIIIGEDNLLNLDKWKDFKTILANYPIIVYPRDNSKINFEIPQVIKENGGKVYFSDAPLYNISSTMIRQYRKKGKKITGLVPDLLELFIIENNLYI